MVHLSAMYSAEAKRLTRSPARAQRDPVLEYMPGLLPNIPWQKWPDAPVELLVVEIRGQGLEGPAVDLIDRKVLKSRLVQPKGHSAAAGKQLNRGRFGLARNP